MSDPGEHRCWVSLGGNVGDVRQTFHAARECLASHDDIVVGRQSGLYRTIPMGTQSADPFLNAVCEVTTRLGPRELLGILQSIENRLGRIRDVRWGPRTIDLDLLSCANQVVNEPDLTIPHPGTLYRRFVLDPLVEVDPHWIHSKCQRSAAELLTRLKKRPLIVSLLDCSQDQLAWMATQIETAFPDVQFVPTTNRSNDALSFQLTSTSTADHMDVIDLSRAPGSPMDQLSSAFTAIFDVPVRCSDW